MIKVLKHKSYFNDATCSHYHHVEVGVYQPDIKAHINSFILHVYRRARTQLMTIQKLAEEEIRNE